MSPEFPKGCIIVGEPNAVVVDGCYVIAKVEDEFIFRQLHIETEPEKWLLSTLDNSKPPIHISGPEMIRARVVQRSTGRRSSRKFYV
jgi:DNA polymerase V